MTSEGEKVARTRNTHARRHIYTHTHTHTQTHKRRRELFLYQQTDSSPSKIVLFPDQELKNVTTVRTHKKLKRRGGGGGRGYDLWEFSERRLL